MRSVDNERSSFRLSSPSVRTKGGRQATAQARMTERVRAYNSRRQPNRPAKECSSCQEKLPEHKFPARPPRSRCTHSVHTCADCLAAWITSQVDSVPNDQIRCPECPQKLRRRHVAACTSPNVARYVKLLSSWNNADWRSATMIGVYMKWSPASQTSSGA